MSKHGSKATQMREAIAELGPKCTLPQVKAHMKKKYGYEPLDTTFYKFRRAAQESPAPAPAPAPATAAVAPKEPVVKKAEKVDMAGILELVDAGKKLVASLGKDQAKELLDRLS